MPRIRITTDHAASHYGVPVCLIGGKLVDDPEGLRVCMEALGWSRSDASERTGKSVGAIDRYRSGQLPVPAEVWLVLRDALDRR